MLNNNKIVIEKYGTHGIIFYPDFQENSLVHEFQCLVKNFSPYDLRRNKEFFSYNGSTYCYSIFPTVSEKKEYKNKTSFHLFKLMIFNAILAQEWADYFKTEYIENFQKEDYIEVRTKYRKNKPKKKQVLQKTNNFLKNQIKILSSSGIEKKETLEKNIFSENS